MFVFQVDVRRQLQESVQLSRQLADRIAAVPQPTDRDRRLQSLFDTISAWMQDYTEDEYVELSKCVWDKLFDIRQARVARQHGPVFYPPAEGHHTRVCQAPPAQLHGMAVGMGQTPPQVSTPRRDQQLLNLSLGSTNALLAGLSPTRPLELTDNALRSLRGQPVVSHYQQL